MALIHRAAGRDRETSFKWKLAARTGKLPLGGGVDADLRRSYVKPMHGLGSAITVTPVRRLALEELQMMRAEGRAPRVACTPAPLINGHLLPVRLGDDDYYW